MSVPRSLPPVLAALAVAAACSSSTAPLPAEGPPAELRVNFSGFGYGSHEVWVERGDTLRVVRRTWERPAAVESTTVVPSADAWRAFWASARGAGVDAWPARCVDERIADGSGLSLRIVAGGRTVEAAMSNSWARADGRCAGPDPSAEVRAFLAAVAALIGRPYPA